MNTRHLLDNLSFGPYFVFFGYGFVHPKDFGMNIIPTLFLSANISFNLQLHKLEMQCFLVISNFLKNGWFSSTE